MQTIGWPASSLRAFLGAAWPFLLGAGAGVLRLSIGSWPIDDAYITFRHSRNLLDGMGFVFNPGDAVLGTSAPLYGLLLALIGRMLPVDMVHISLATNAIADGAAVILLCLIGRRFHLPEWAVALLGALWAFYPLGIRYSVGGMEAPVAGALLLGIWLSVLDDRDLLAGSLLGIAVLVRPELIVVGGVLCADTLVRRRTLPWTAIAAFCLITGPWIAWATVVYGSAIPQSVQAKAHDIYVTTAWANARQMWIQVAGVVSSNPNFGAQGLQTNNRITPDVAEAAGSILVLGLCGLGVHSVAPLFRRAGALFLGVSVVVMGYGLASLRGNLIAEWYLIPIMPVLLLALVCGLVRASRTVWAVWTPLVWFAAVALVGIQIAGLNVGRDPSRPWAIPRSVWTEREVLYRSAAAVLRSEVRPSDVVAAPEIGTLGYFCGCQILDTVGLVTPRALKYYPLPPGSNEVNNAIPAQLVSDERPEYVVTLDVFARRTLLKSDWFWLRYRAEWQRDTTAFSSKALVIFRRIPNAP